MQTVILSRTSRILAGHLWVFSNELSVSPRGFEAGSIVEVRDRKNAFLGIGYINPNSLISVRILTREREEINEGFFKKRILNALEYRRRFVKDPLGPDAALRAVYSEADYLPGLIIDRYAGCVAMQFHTLGMERLSDFVINAVEDIFKPETIVFKNDASIRTLEGIPLEKKIVKGGLEKLPLVRIGEAVFEVDPMAGQKTGFFLDQSENMAAFAAVIKKNGGKAGDERGLDLFCYTGAWSIEAAKKANVTVTGVDSSEAAIALSGRNAELNGLSGRCAFVRADVFDFIKAELSKKNAYGFIALDPPAFVKSKAKFAEGVRAYRQINADAMRLLKIGGLLATSSCSFHVDRNTFLETLRDAARDAGRLCRVIETRSQAKDHPVNLGVPETEYLKCVIMEVG